MELTNSLTVVTERRDGRDIHINVLDFGGSGPVALLHHANGFCAGTWSLVARELTRHYHVFALDARGHGDSDAAGAMDGSDLSVFVQDEIAVAEALCRLCDVPRIAYGIGSSFGGVVTAAAEAAHPGLFERMALLDPPIIATPELNRHLGLPMPTRDEWQGPPVAQTRKRRAHFPSRNEASSSWRTRGMFASWPDEAFELYLSECLRPSADGGVELKCSPMVEAHVYLATDNMSALTYAPAVRVPVLYARASRGLFTSGFCAAVASLFPDARFEEIEGGHLLPLEAPGAVVAHLLDFSGS